VLDLAYGENPHQRAAYYAERGARRHLLSRVEQLHGKELSFNNLNDLLAARSLAREFALPDLRHRQAREPVRASAVGATLEEAYDKALASDPTSAYGGVVVLNREVEAPLGREARGAVRRGPVRAGLHRGRARRVTAERRTPASSSTASGAPASPGERHYKRVLGGMLVQDPDAEIEDRDTWQLVTGELSEPEVGRPRLRVARLQARRVERDRAREGPADDRDRRRPDEPGRRGADRSRESGRVRHDPTGSALASDAFFPFPDGPQVALDAGRDRDRPARRLAQGRRT
jgi:phosphoribosylaminoimidazolecarboxamide formyltransferase/IMP cyclohydrolase